MRIPNTDPCRRRILKLYGWILLVGFSYLIWYRVTGLGLSCMVYETTGVLCPGCGTSRMCLALLRLDLAAAIRFNPVVFFLLCFWNPVALLYYWGRPAWIRKPKVLYGFFWCSVGLMSVFGIVRNFI